MNDIQEKMLRDMLGDLVAAKSSARKVITENIVTFVKKVRPTTHAADGEVCTCPKDAPRKFQSDPICDICGSPRR